MSLDLLTIILFSATALINLSGAAIVYRQRVEILERIDALKTYLDARYVCQEACRARHETWERLLADLARRLVRVEP